MGFIQYHNNFKLCPGPTVREKKEHPHHSQKVWELLVSFETPRRVYRIQVPGQGRRLYHVNLLKGWQEREDSGLCNVEIDWDEEGKEWSLELHAQVAAGEPVLAWQQHQIPQVLDKFWDVFVCTPGRTRAPFPPPPGEGSVGAPVSYPPSLEGNPGKGSPIHVSPRGHQGVL